MAHFHDNTNLYDSCPTASTAGQLDIDQFLHRTSAVEEVVVQPIDTSLEAIMKMLEEPYPGPMVGLPTSDYVDINHGYGCGEHQGLRLVGWCLTRCL